MDFEICALTIALSASAFFGAVWIAGIIFGLAREHRKARAIRDLDLIAPAPRESVVRIRKGTLPDAIDADYR